MLIVAMCYTSIDAHTILVTPTGSSRALARRALFRAPAAATPQLAVVLNSIEGRIHVRTQFSVVLISTENEKRVTSPRHPPPYCAPNGHAFVLN